MRGATRLLLVLALAATACSSDLGRDIPACDRIESSLLIQYQAVPSATQLPCINELKAGWKYKHLKAESGKVRFDIDSDRVGERFLQVTLEASCDVGDAEPFPSDEEDATLHVAVEAVPAFVEATIVTTDAEAEAWAEQLAAQLEGIQVNQRRLTLFVDEDDGRPFSDRMHDAMGRGTFALVITERDAAEATVELRVAGNDPQPGLSLDDAFEEISHVLPRISYKGAWYYQFDGGCVTYRFDGVGPGSERIATDVTQALGLFPRSILLDIGRDAGIFE